MTGTMLLALGGRSTNNMPIRHTYIQCLASTLVSSIFAIAAPLDAGRPQTAGPVQSWGLPPLPAGIGPVEK
jgi:hypothetical protein